jgi:opacity protein-like surface antigen
MFVPRRFWIVAPSALVSVGLSHVAWAVSYESRYYAGRDVVPSGVTIVTDRVAVSHTGPSFGAGVGLELAAARWVSLIGEWRYHRVIGPESRTFTTDGLFVNGASYSTLRAGLSLRVH